MGRGQVVLLAFTLALGLTSCSAVEDPAAEPAPTVASTPARSSTPAPPAPPPGATPPDWLGTRVLPHEPGGYGEVQPTPPELRRRAFTLPDQLPMLPGEGFASRITTVPASVLERSTWEPSCPVGANDLRWIRLTFWGFDDARHTGELLVHRDAAEPLVEVFRQLYAERFPIEQMVITTRADLDAPPTGDGNGTGAFSCRPVTGGSSYSQHAYGLAVDINPFQNPYTKGEVLLPELAGAYLDRDWRRPGMILPDGPVVRAFASIGWTWGGTWNSLKDRHHFSANGR